MRAALLLALLLAGCASSPSSSPSSSAPAQASAFPWGIADCAFVIAIVPVDPAAIAARLPEGFTAAPTSLAGVPVPGRGSLELDAYQCASGQWSRRNMTPLAYGSHYVGVEPPEALREESYQSYFVKWDVLVSDDEARSAFAAAGLPSHGGDATASITGTAVSATLAFDDGGGFALTGVLQGSPSGGGEPLPFMEFTPLADGASLARWHARLHDASIAQGTGIVQLPEGSWVRDAVGAPSAPARFIAGTWNLDEADVAFPIQWP